MVVGDFNHDSRLDIAIANVDGITVLLNEAFNVYDLAIVRDLEDKFRTDRPEPKADSQKLDILVLPEAQTQGGQHFTQCSPTGYTCNFLITMNRNGQLQVDTDPSTQYYPPDSPRGSLIGFKNSSNQSIYSLSLNVAPGTPYEMSDMCQPPPVPIVYNDPNVSIITLDAAANFDIPPYYFHSACIGTVCPNPRNTKCDVVFSGGIPKGGSTYFSVNSSPTYSGYWQVTHNSVIPWISFQEIIAKDQTANATLTLYPPNQVSVTLNLTTTTGTGSAVFADTGLTTKIINTPGPAQIPVRGVEASSTSNNIRLSASVNGVQREVNFTVIKVEKIPLGGSTSLSHFIIGKVYVPDKWGGELKLAGSNVQLFYTDGSDLDSDTAIKVFKGELDANQVAQGSPCAFEAQENKHGWYYAKILNDASTVISAEFVQRGAAATIPWNGWYWPSLNTVNPNLYDSTGSYTPLADYDTIYGTSTRAEEEANYSGGDSWWGHCWGWSLAAIAKAQPGASTINGVDFNQDEMEGLYTELAEGATVGWTWNVGSPSSEIPAGPPTAATGEAVDSWADDVQNGLRQYIRQQNKAMNGNLRDASGGDASQVWNHDVYKYESTMSEAAGGNEKVVEVTTLITANTDSPSMPPDTANREDTYVYVLEYKNDGTIDGSSANQNWRSSTGFAPQCLGTVSPNDLNWQGKHCGITCITKANVDGLYP